MIRHGSLYMMVTLIASWPTTGRMPI
ncbi:hypothetical protein FB595_1783, partial [Sphingobium sp. AEW010]